MSLWQNLKERIKREGDEGHPTARKAGEKIGTGIRRTGEFIAEKYRKRYSGGEYREQRIKETTAKAKEMEAKARLERAKTSRAKASESSGGMLGFKPNYDIITGGQDKKKKGAYDHLFGDKRI